MRLDECQIANVLRVRSAVPAQQSELSVKSRFRRIESFLAG